MKEELELGQQQIDKLIIGTKVALPTLSMTLLIGNSHSTEKLMFILTLNLPEGFQNLPGARYSIPETPTKDL